MIQGNLFDDVGVAEWVDHWRGMPSFVQEDLAPADSLVVELEDSRLYIHFASKEDGAEFRRRYSAELARRGHRVERDWLSALLEQDLDAGLDSDERRRTQSVWWPEAEIGKFAGKAYVHRDNLPRGERAEERDGVVDLRGRTSVPANQLPGRVQASLPRYPIYVPTKGRYDSLQTIRALEAVGVPYRAVVEEQERDLYEQAGVPAERLLVLPHRDRGLVVTRNWIWDHALSEGHRRFWTMDDNIQGFYRLHRNLKTPVGDGTILRAIEDFADRYENLPVCGMNYFMFASRKTEIPPLYPNARVYSNMLIETDFRDPRGRPYRNEGFYNDDTDLCLRILKDGNCTVLFNAFLVFKSTTMSLSGGMTDHYRKVAVDEKWRALAREAIARGYYQDPADAAEDEERLSDGRWRMAAELAAKHPDVAKITRKWHRWQHTVDYSEWTRPGRKGNKLRLRPGVVVPPESDDFGMVLRVADPPARRPRIEVAAAPVFSPEPDSWRPDEPPDLSRVLGPVGLDFETDGLKWWRGKRPVGLAVSWNTDSGVQSRYLPFRHASGNLDEETVRRWAREQLAGRHLVGHNIKFDAHMSRAWEVDLEALGCRLSCTMGRAALLDDRRRGFGLDEVARDVLGEGKVSGVDATRMLAYGAHQVAPYARKDSELALRIFLRQEEEIREQELGRVASVEDSVLWPTMEMERNAALIDVPKLRTWVRQSERDLVLLQLQMAKLVGHPVNPDRPEEIAQLFQERGLKSDARTPSGKRDSFAASVLERAAETDEAAALALKIARLKDLRSKYLLPYSGLSGDGAPLPDTTVGEDGILRFSLHPLRGDQYGTVSGRFSMSKADRDGEGANLQQVFSVENQTRTHGEKYLIRELFVSQPGALLLAADAKQIEYRVFAHLSRDPALLAAYREDPETDFHGVVGEMVRPYRPDFQRKRIKITNFMLLFGGGAGKTAELFGCSREEAEAFVADYDRAFPAARATLRRAMEVARERGFVRTVLGRRSRFRPCPTHAWRCPPGCATSPRLHKALNNAVSGSAADLNKLKMVSLYRERKRVGLTMRLTVHDEFVGDVPDQHAAGLVAEVLARQEIPLSVPILWDVKTGKNWKECK